MPDSSSNQLLLIKQEFNTLLPLRGCVEIVGSLKGSGNFWSAPDFDDLPFHFILRCAQLLQRKLACCNPN